MSHVFVTSSLPYVNAKPHLGFAMEIIEADTLARFFRQRAYTTHFQTGTDEHGTKIQKQAQLKKILPSDLCAENSAQYQNLREILNLSFDDFIRTSDQKRHFPAVQTMWQRLLASGKLAKRSYQGIYCSGCEAFLLPKDLIQNKCPSHPNLNIEKVTEENWFFQLSDFSTQIVELIETKQLKIIPQFRATEFLNLAQQGLTDISFSRPKTKLTWGVPVPNDPEQTMYVWCDALTNYISALGFGSGTATNFQKFWEDPQTRKIHVIGKDIVRFHAGIWIGMLLAAKLPLPTEILVHGFLTNAGQKMSKSLGNVETPIQLVTKFGTDALRYFLLSEIPLGQDGDFSLNRFEQIYKAELADNLGNLLARITKLAGKFTKTELQIQKLDPQITAAIQKMWQDLEAAMIEFDFRTALQTIFTLTTFANKFVDQVKPWTLEPAERLPVLLNLLEILFQTSLALIPFLPTTAEKMLKNLGFAKISAKLTAAQKSVGRQFQPQATEILFPKKHH